MITQEQREQWDRDGYIIVPNALDAIGLDRVRAAYERVEADLAPAWRESVLKGTYSGGYGNGPDAHTMNGIYEYDDVFLDLAANPITTPIIEDVIGQNFQVMEMICHNHHGNTNAHTGWHRDWPPYVHPKYALKAKVFYYLDDQEEDMGCFSLVPGSHLLPDDPPRNQYVGKTLTDMPGCKKMVVPAGSAVVWNVICWHTGTANTSTRDRRTVIYGYMPFWVKKWEERMPPQAILNWANTPIRRQMMGIHAVYGRHAWDRKDVARLPDQDEAFKGHKG